MFTSVLPGQPLFQLGLTSSEFQRKLICQKLHEVCHCIYLTSLNSKLELKGTGSNFLHKSDANLYGKKENSSRF